MRGRLPLGGQPCSLRGLRGASLFEEGRAAGMEIEFEEEKESPYAHPPVDEVIVTLQADDARLQSVLKILDRHRIPWLDEGLTDGDAPRS